MNSDREDEINGQEEIIYAVLVEEEVLETQIIQEGEPSLGSETEVLILESKSEQVVVTSFQDRRQS